MASSLNPLPEGERWETVYSYLYLTALFGTPVLAVVLAIHLGYVTPDITVTANVNLGGPLEWLASGFVILFLYWSAVQVARVTGVGFIKGSINAAQRFMDGYQAPGRGSEPPGPNEPDGDVEGEG